MDENNRNSSGGEVPGSTGPGSQGAGDVEFEPQWPQRPGRPRPEAALPRLDPPEGTPPTARVQGGFGDTEIQPSKWTSHPTTPGNQPRTTAAEGFTKETQVLPVVESSRFDNGRAASQQARVAQPQKPGRHADGGQAPHVAVPRAPGKPMQPNANPAQLRGAGQSPSNVPYSPTMPYVPPKPGYEPYDPYDEDEGFENAYVPGQRRPVPSSTTQVRGGKGQPGLQGYPPVAVEQKRKPRWRWMVWTLLGILGIFGIVVAAFSLAWQGQYAGKIYSGVQIMGISVGGKTQDEARKLLDDKVQAYLAQPVVLRWSGKEWRPSADQIGLKVDTKSTVSEAFAVGRSGDFTGNIQQQWTSAQMSYNVPLNVQFSEPDLQNYLTNVVAAETNQKLFEGDVRLNGTEVVALPGKEGRTLDTYSTIVAVRNSVAAMQPETKIDIPVEVVQPSVTADEVAEVQKLLSVRVSSPITGTVPGKQFILDRDALVRFTTIERNPDRTAKKHVNLGWRDNELKILADKWAHDATRPAQNAKFDWQNGSVSVVSESVDGVEVASDPVIAAIKEHADTPDKRQFDLPAKIITATVSSKDIGSLGIKEQIGQGTSTFKGSSPERATNIKVAASLLTGSVVPPGGTFSFLDAEGGIDEAHGFVPGYVIAAERTQLGVGGGVCQASTTTFRAAFWAGLQITERNQHSYRVSWYEADGQPVGFDAAVFDPGVDLKFINTTGNYILIKADTGPESLTVTIYGTKIPGEVKLEGPVITNRVSPPPDVYEVDPRLPAGTKKQVETAHGGLDTLITRRIVVPGQPDKVDRFHSSYKAWPNWFIVSSPSQIPAGSQTPQVSPTAKP